MRRSVGGDGRESLQWQSSRRTVTVRLQEDASCAALLALTIAAFRVCCASRPRRPSGGGRAGYALLGTSFPTSPLVLPFELALLMLVLRGTPLGAAILEWPHLVYIRSVVYCLAALASACLAFNPALEKARSWDQARRTVQVPDRHHPELQRWLVAHGRQTEDVPTAHGEASSSPRPISLAEYGQAPRDAVPGR
jgi:hypothetical protein